MAAPTDIGRDAPPRLDITSMTCASCAARVEKRLNGVDGVTATVNFATGRATARTEGDVTVDRSS